MLISMVCTLQAQTKSEAADFYNRGEYEKAKEIYGALLKKKPKDALLNFCYGKCLYSLKDLSAKHYFDLAKDKYPQVHRMMGDLYFENYLFENAAQEYALYLEEKKDDALQRRYQQSLTGADMMKRVELIQIIDSVVMPKTNFLAHYKLSAESGALSQTSAENTTYTTERNDRKFYTQEVNGQRDVFYTYLLLNDWSEPTSLSKTINTPNNESFPYMMADGITLYYASDAPEGLGGYDIYMTRFSPISNEYLPAQNLGMPFNSPANDYMFAVDETNNIGFFATDRHQAQDSVAIYRFAFSKQKNIIKDVDTATLCAYAQLRKYQKVKAQTAKQKETRPVTKNPNNKGIDFVVNAETTYRSIDEFRSDETKNRFLSLQILKSDLAVLKKKLQQKRDEYANSTDETKEELAWEILTIEKELLTMQRRIQLQIIELRKLETQYLNQ